MFLSDQIIECDKGGPTLTCPEIMLPGGKRAADFGAVRRSQASASANGPRCRSSPGPFDPVI